MSLAGGVGWGSPRFGIIGNSARETLSADERTRQDVERDTAYFRDDLTDPRNPGHDAWVARQKERIDCNALVDPEHPGHREAVQSISHVNHATHESILRRIKDELAKH